MKVQRLHVDARLIQDPDDVGQLGLAAGQLHGHAARSVAPHVAKARQELGQTIARLGIGGGHLHRRAPDLGLELRRGALGDDPAVVDDPDSVGQGVGLLQVLSG
jgi:hypothetical protein